MRHSEYVGRRCFTRLASEQARNESATQQTESVTHSQDLIECCAKHE